MVELPFGLPLELCEIIFNYLKTKDLLTCTLVSKAWSTFVGHNCMKNILLKVNDKTQLKDVVCSEKIYKKAKLTKLSKDSLRHVIRFLSSTVVELELDECAGEGHDDYTMILPNLRELTLSRCSTEMFNLFNVKYERLETLSLNQLHGPSVHLKIFLKNNGTIDELNFYISDSTACIFDQLSDLHLHLKSIFISHKSNNELQSRTLRAIEKFLISQGDRLEIISLINSANLLLLLRIWNRLKAVRRLYFFSTDPFFDYINESQSTLLSKNFTLRELELHSLAPYPFALEDVRPFLDASKNLNSLAVWHLRQDIAAYAEKQLKNLKSISYVTADDDLRVYLKSKNGTKANDKLRFLQFNI